MTPHVVADVGNSRIKWGLCAPGEAGVARTASLPDDPAAWEAQLARWRGEPPLAGVEGPLAWVLASVRPSRSDRLRGWLEARGQRVAVLAGAGQLPLEVAVEKPEHVGIDRLLDAVAARRVLPAGRGAVLVDAGSAVTADWLDEGHVFRGGAIFPGIRLMAEALHNYTALLPLVEVREPVPDLPGKSTAEAMEAGIFVAVLGGVREAVRRYAERAKGPPQVFVTGGDAGLLLKGVGPGAPGPWATAVHWPNQTLEGILYSAEGLP
jgi:type III pantothenate kinase